MVNMVVLMILNCRLTTTCMLAFSIIISASQYVGNPIDCIHTNDIPEVNFSIDKLGQT